MARRLAANINWSRLFKHLLFRTIVLFFFWRKKKEAIPKNNVKKVLIIRQDNRIGNLLFISPLIKMVYQTFQVKPDVVVGGSFAEIIANNPQVGSCFVYAQKKFIKNPLLFFKFLYALQKQHYDLVIDCKKVFSFNNALLTLWANSDFKIGLKNELSQYYLSKFFEYKDQELTLHESQFLAMPLISEFGLNLADLPFMEFHFAKDFQFDNSLKNYIAIHIGGRGTKTIDAQLVNQIASAFSPQPVVIIYGPDEREKIKKISDLPNVRKVLPPNISSLAACIQNAKLFVTPDTGPLHIASALNQNIAALFSVSSATAYGPRTAGKCLIVTTNQKNQAEIVQEIITFANSI